MKYMWSKNRIAKHLLPIILKDRKPNQWYVEPFVWGANMIDKVEWNRIWSDVDEYLIELLKHCADGKSNDLVDYITEEQYNHIKNNKEKYSKVEVAHCGFNSSFWAKWFGGFTRPRKNWWDRDCVCGKNLLLKQMDRLKDVKLFNLPYQELVIPNNSIIYCDIPYKNTTKYKTGWFDYEHFYNWCRKKKAEWHTIFISEYNMPDDFICVWEKELINNLNDKKATEKLFTL